MIAHGGWVSTAGVSNLKSKQLLTWLLPVSCSLYCFSFFALPSSFWACRQDLQHNPPLERDEQRSCRRSSTSRVCLAPRGQRLPAENSAELGQPLPE